MSIIKRRVEMTVHSEIYEMFVGQSDIPEGEIDKAKPYPLWSKPPAWIKELGPKSGLMSNDPSFLNGPQMSYVKCPSTQNILKKAIVIPSLAEGNIKITARGVESVFSNPYMALDSHRREQMGNSSTSNWMNIKFQLPYVINNRGTLLFTAPVLHAEHRNSGFEVMFGMVHNPKAMSVNINCLVNTDITREINIVPGQPLCYIILPEEKGKVQLEMIKAKNQMVPGGMTKLWRWPNRYKMQ